MDTIMTWIVVVLFFGLLALTAAGAGCESRTYSLDEFACVAPTKETK